MFKKMLNGDNQIQLAQSWYKLGGFSKHGCTLLMFLVAFPSNYTRICFKYLLEHRL